ncbi:MAG: class I SAM-dependent methyltransferase [Burkholderiales bacterium]
MTSPTQIKAKEFESWQSVTPGWRKHDQLLKDAFADVSEALLDSAGVSAGQRVLDVACGTGEPAIPAALRVGAEGKVTAIDFVPEMLAIATEKVNALGLDQIELCIGDGEQLALPADSYDAATMRWGLMFMPDPVKCLTGIFLALKPGARFATACWDGPEANPWASLPLAVLQKYMELPPPGQTGIFAFADPERIRAVMSEAGFRDISVDALDVMWTGADSGSDYFEQVIELAGPLASLYAKLSNQERAAFASEVAQQADRISASSSGIAIPGRTWIAAGTR